MEPGGSLLCSQETTTAPVLKLSPPVQFMLRPPFNNTISPHICLDLRSCHFLSVFLPKPGMYFFHSLFLLILFSCPTRHILLDLLILTKLDNAYKLWSFLCAVLWSYYLLPIRSIYLPQRPVLQHPRCLFFPHWDRPSLAFKTMDYVLLRCVF
jgi:hypothetical protein